MAVFFGIFKLVEHYGLTIPPITEAVTDALTIIHLVFA
jgi:hypothetical protein